MKDRIEMIEKQLAANIYKPCGSCKVDKPLEEYIVRRNGVIYGVKRICRKCEKQKEAEHLAIQNGYDWQDGERPNSVLHSEQNCKM